MIAADLIREYFLPVHGNDRQTYAVQFHARRGVRFDLFAGNGRRSDLPIGVRGKVGMRFHARDHTLFFTYLNFDHFGVDEHAALCAYEIDAAIGTRFTRPDGTHIGVSALFKMFHRDLLAGMHVEIMCSTAIVAIKHRKIPAADRDLRVIIFTGLGLKFKHIRRKIAAFRLARQAQFGRFIRCKIFVGTCGSFALTQLLLPRQKFALAAVRALREGPVFNALGHLRYRIGKISEFCRKISRLI